MEVFMSILDLSMGRRHFMGVSTALGAAYMLGAPRLAEAAAAFPYPSLPYAEDALDPVISTRTVGFHFGKHHKAYVDKLNAELAKPENAKLAAITDLKALILKSAGKKGNMGIFNNAAQIWNHDFYWSSLKPGGTLPSAAMLQKINEAFGDLAGFNAQFAEAANAQFGSGWAWLAANRQGKLEIIKTANADSPLLLKGYKSLLAIDVWEHAYYLDYQNKRSAYVAEVISKLLNWEFAESNLTGIGHSCHDHG
jgi:Fe-Mn family superoxide dismutase